MEPSVFTAAPEATRITDRAYSFVACIATGHALYVVVDVIEVRHSPPDVVHINVTTGGGDALEWAGTTTGTGNKRGGLIISEFLLPPDGTDRFEVTVTANDAHVLTATATGR